MNDNKINKKYIDWILKYQKKHKNVYGMCEKATIEMLKCFPELIRKRGHVFVFNQKNSKIEHWWLKTKNGIIVDPTKKQFGFIIKYIEWDENKSEPIGKCLNCGGYIFNDSFSTDLCSEKCNKIFMESLNSIK